MNKTLAFYYLWYGAPIWTGANALPGGDKSGWSHWDHHILPHWNPSTAALYPGEETRWIPPHDIHAPFYPARGPYSSLNPAVLRSQFAEMRAAGIGIAVASWWGREGVSKGDSQGVLTDDALGVALDAALSVAQDVGAHGGGTSGVTTVAVHLEPYAGRTAASTRADIAYIFEKFGHHPALFRDPKTGRPLFFIYDSYHIASSDWASELSSLRSTPHDAIFFGLWLAQGDASELASGGFDGAYTYFASDSVGYGSNAANWAAMSREAAARGLAFSPSVSPGYDDSKIRPWNRVSTRRRRLGESYKSLWETALTVLPACVTITSFNEWGEGTQIESAVPRMIDVDALALSGEVLPRHVRASLQLLNPFDVYDDYLPGGPSFYLDLTAEFSLRLGATAGLGEHYDSL